MHSFGLPAREDTLRQNFPKAHARASKGICLAPVHSAKLSKSRSLEE